MSGLSAPFRVRSYRFQWPADLLTSWAFEMETLILGWYILVETGSVLLLTVYGSLLYTGTLIAPIIGVASDRLGHRELLSAMRALYALIAGTLMVLTFAGQLNPLVVLVLAAFSGIVRPSDMGLRGALIAETMPVADLTAAMGISRTTSDSARIAGALAGAGLVALYGIGPAYTVITAFYALGALLTWGAVVKPPAATAPVSVTGELAASTSPWRDLREGLAHVWNTPSVLALVWLAFLFNFSAFSITTGLLPYVAKEIYRTDQTGLGYLVASLAFGALVGALAMTRFGGGMALPRVMIVSAVIWHSLLLSFAQTVSMPVGLVLLFLTGVAQSLTMVSHTVILLRASERRFRGRIMGVRMMAIYSLPVGLLIAGALIERIGFAATATLYAALGLVCTIIIALRWREHMWPAVESAPAE